MGIYKDQIIAREELAQSKRGICKGCGDPLSVEDEDGYCSACSRRIEKVESE